MKQRTFTLTDEQIKWLKKNSEETGIPQATTVRWALDAYIDSLKE